jgi:hypothetical protein
MIIKIYIDEGLSLKQAEQTTKFYSEMFKTDLQLTFKGEFLLLSDN